MNNLQSPSPTEPTASPHPTAPLVAYLSTPSAAVKLLECFTDSTDRAPRPHIYTTSDRTRAVSFRRTLAKYIERVATLAAERLYLPHELAHALTAAGLDIYEPPPGSRASTTYEDTATHAPQVPPAYRPRTLSPVLYDTLNRDKLEAKIALIAALRAYFRLISALVKAVNRQARAKPRPAAQTLSQEQRRAARAQMLEARRTARLASIHADADAWAAQGLELLESAAAPDVIAEHLNAGAKLAARARKCGLDPVALGLC